MSSKPKPFDTAKEMAIWCTDQDEVLDLSYLQDQGKDYIPFIKTETITAGTMKRCYFRFGPIPEDVLKRRIKDEEDFKKLKRRINGGTFEDYSRVLEDIEFVGNR